MSKVEGALSVIRNQTEQARQRAQGHRPEMAHDRDLISAHPEYQLARVAEAKQKVRDQKIAERGR